MGVYAKDHAQQLILDLAVEAGDGTTSPLSPRAQLLLLNIAGKITGDMDIKNRDVTKGKLWDHTRNETYFDGLGLKARAIGYNVPKKITYHPASPSETQLDTKGINRIKAAVNKAVGELMYYGLLVQTEKGRPTVTATYALPFLKAPCSICRTPNGGIDETLHLNDNKRYEEFERISESRGGGQDAYDAGFQDRPEWGEVWKPF